MKQWNCVSLRTLMMEKVRRVIPSAAPALTSRCVMLEARSANVARLSSTCFLQLGLRLGLGFNPSLTELYTMCDVKQRGYRHLRSYRQRHIRHKIALAARSDSFTFVHLANAFMHQYDLCVTDLRKTNRGLIIVMCSNNVCYNSTGLLYSYI